MLESRWDSSRLAQILQRRRRDIFVEPNQKEIQPHRGGIFRFPSDDVAPTELDPLPLRVSTKMAALRAFLKIGG